MLLNVSPRTRTHSLTPVTPHTPVTHNTSNIVSPKFHRVVYASWRDGCPESELCAWECCYVLIKMLSIDIASLPSLPTIPVYIVSPKFHRFEIVVRKLIPGFDPLRTIVPSNYPHGIVEHATLPSLPTIPVYYCEPEVPPF